MRAYFIGEGTWGVNGEEFEFQVHPDGAITWIDSDGRRDQLVLTPGSTVVFKIADKERPVSEV